MKRVFVLSPADCNGLRARWVLKKTSRSELAQRLRAGGAPLGEVFSFLSGLYFRGKLAYARRFARPIDDVPAFAAGSVFVITACAGLRAPDTPITQGDWVTCKATGRSSQPKAPARPTPKTVR